MNQQSIKALRSMAVTVASFAIFYLCAMAQPAKTSTDDPCPRQASGVQNPLEMEAMMAEAQGDTPKAVALLNHAAIELSSQSNPSDHARVESELGDISLGRGALNEAFKHKKNAFDAYATAGVAIEVRRTALSMASILLHRRDREGAGRYLDIARTARVALSCLDDDDRAALASLSAWEDQLSGATSLSILESKTALNLWRQAHGEDHPFTGWGHVLLGDALSNAGDQQQAIDQFRIGVDVLSKSLPKTDKHVQIAVEHYTYELQRSGRRSEAAIVKNSLISH